MAKRALEQNVDYDEIESTFRESRKSNGVATRAARKQKVKSNGQSTFTGPSVDNDDDADEQSAAYEKDFSEERNNSVVSEMTEFESDDEA